MRSIRSYANEFLSAKAIARLRVVAETVIGPVRHAMSRTVAIEKLLWGGDMGCTAAKFSRVTGDFLRPSTRLIDSPYVELLRLFDEHGQSLFEPECLRDTGYYRNAKQVIDLQGKYYDCRSADDIVLQVKRFIGNYKGEPWADNTRVSGSSGRLMPVSVRKIKHSDGCYEIDDGHHRLAIAYMHGQLKHRVYVLREPAVLTPLQQKLLDVLWTRGKRILYQPVNAPEIGRDWRLIRRCTDRFEKIREWMSQRGSSAATMRTYCDLGSSYGWFVNEMQTLGLQTQGVERDPAAIELGQLVYGLDPSQIVRGDLVEFLTQHEQKFDIVSCFSVIHHFALGLGNISASEFLQLLDKVTGEILLFDTGENHESWFRESLKDWDVDFIQSWVLQNSSFTKVYPLGPDEDASLHGGKNYGRMLFACTREV